MKNISVIILFGFIAGILGGLFVNNYLNVYNYSQFQDVLLSNNVGKSGIIIKDAKKIVIEQNKQIKNIINLNQDKIVRIYKKKSSHNIPVLGDYYQKNDSVVSGLIITSDGWVISRNFIDKKQNIKDVVSSYIMIDSDNKIYNIDDFKSEKQIVFLHMANAKELPVTNVVPEENIENGEVIISLDKDDNVGVSYVSGKTDSFIKSCDKLEKAIVLTNNKVSDSFFFDIQGGLVSLSDNSGKMLLVDNFKFQISNLLNKNKLKKPLWGINYIDLSDIITASSSIKQKGALIYNNNGDAIIKNSIADRAGFKKGDIIVFVNNIEINKNNSLNYILQNYKIGDNLDITYIRNGKKKIINLDI